MAPMRGLLADAMDSPLFNMGIGLLAASGPSTMPISTGQALGQGVQFAQQAQLSSMQNAQARERLRSMAEQRKASSAVRDLITQSGGSPALQALATINPSAALQTMMPQPTGLQREYEFLISQGVSKERALESLQKGTTINVGDNKLDEPIPIPQIQNVRLPDGKSVPIGTTFRQAKESGAQVLSTDEQSRVQQTDSALAILDTLEGLATGPEGIFQQIEPGAINRGAAAIQFALEDLTQEDPKVSRFRDLSAGTLTSFVRLLGEKGSLSDGDVKRAISLLPSTGSVAMAQLPDTRDVAKQKLRDLRQIIYRGVSNLNQQPTGEARRYRYDPATGQFGVAQ